MCSPSITHTCIDTHTHIYMSEPMKYAPENSRALYTFSPPTDYSIRPFHIFHALFAAHCASARPMIAAARGAYICRTSLSQARTRFVLYARRSATPFAPPHPSRASHHNFFNFAPCTARAATLPFNYFLSFFLFFVPRIHARHR